MSYVSQNLRNASNNFFHFRQTVLIWLKRHVWIDLWLFLEILYTVDRRDGKGEVLSEARIGKKFWTVITLRKGKEKGKEIAQQVLRVCCKEEISPYEITVDLVTKRGFFFFFWYSHLLRDARIPLEESNAWRFQSRQGRPKFVLPTKGTSTIFPHFSTIRGNKHHSGTR